MTLGERWISPPHFQLSFSIIEEMYYFAILVACFRILRVVCWIFRGWGGFNETNK